MATLTSPVEPTVEIRAQTIAILTREFGSPESGESFERWVIKPPAPRHPVHVVVNAPAATDRAHVLVFDPGASNGDQVLEMNLRAMGELTWLVEHIRQSVAPLLNHVTAAAERHDATRRVLGGRGWCG